jgi:hypothetical protein
MNGCSRWLRSLSLAGRLGHVAHDFACGPWSRSTFWLLRLPFCLCQSIDHVCGLNVNLRRRDQRGGGRSDGAAVACPRNARAMACGMIAPPPDFRATCLPVPPPVAARAGDKSLIGVANETLLTTRSLRAAAGASKQKSCCALTSARRPPRAAFSPGDEGVSMSRTRAGSPRKLFPGSKPTACLRPFNEFDAAVFRCTIPHGNAASSSSEIRPR